MQNRREFMDVAMKGAFGTAYIAGMFSGISQLAFGEAAAGLTRSGLRSVLTAVGKAPVEVENPDGTVVMLLPHGGRVLGVFASGSEENFYWVNPKLASEEAARAFYGGKEWQNSGGDRTWLAPEVDLFLPDFPDTGTYFQPRELDPGNYEVEEGPHGPYLVNTLKLRFSRSGRELSMRITKSVGPAPDPLRYEKLTVPGPVEYAGYTQYTSLELLEAMPAPDAPVGLWNLVQMPHGGELLIPTYSRTEPKTWFGNILPDDLKISDHLIRYKMRAKGEHKLGVRAAATAGRVGYLCGEGASCTLIIRNFSVNPSGEYVDVPWGDPGDLGYSTQACNVNSGLGSFSELEYHIPAIGGATGRARCDDTAQVWAFRGALESLQAVARCLLSPEV